MRRILLFVFLALFAATAVIADLYWDRRGLLVTDDGTAATTFALAENDVDTTASVKCADLGWPIDNTKPWGVLVLWKPEVTGDVLDSVLVKVQYSHNDSSWVGNRWDNAPVVFDTTSSYAIAYSYVYADSSAGMVWPAVQYVRFLIWQASNDSTVLNLDSLKVMHVEFAAPRAE